MRKILVVGYTGLAGSAVYSNLREEFSNVFGLASADLDFRDREGVFKLLAEMKPDVIVNAAAVVGGILANRDSPVRFLSDNLRIQTNLLDAAHASDVERFVFLGSSCIYPRLAPQPITEDQLLRGPLEKTNEAYAVAKIAGIKLVDAYNEEYGHSWVSLMPTSLYGPFDTFDMEKGHVIPSLFAKIEHARSTASKSVELWGTGKPLREFLHSRDLAAAVKIAIGTKSPYSMFNIGSGINVTINELAHDIARIVNYQGDIVFNPNFPDGTYEKLMDSSRMRALGWQPKIGLEDGLRETYDWYTKNLDVRVRNRK